MEVNTLCYPDHENASPEANQSQQIDGKRFWPISASWIDSSQTDETTAKILDRTGLALEHLTVSPQTARCGSAPPPLPVKVQAIVSSQGTIDGWVYSAKWKHRRVSLQPQIQGRIDRVLIAR